MDRTELKVGDILTLYIIDDVGTANDRFDSDAVVEQITEDGTILVRAKDYKGYKNDGSDTTEAVGGGESKLFNLSYWETGGRSWKIQEGGDVENETVED